MIWFALCAILYSTLRGFGEGQTMYFPNVRQHPLFAWYHSARIAEAATLCSTTWIFFDGCSINPLWFAAVFFLSWEAFELSYFFTRCGQVGGHENVYGVWFVDGQGVIWIHIRRLLIGAALALWCKIGHHGH